jgi:hypothetical protein
MGCYKAFDQVFWIAVCVNRLLFPTKRQREVNVRFVGSPIDLIGLVIADTWTSAQYPPSTSGSKQLSIG